jgi:parallel beta-helix repeat protein
VGAATGQEPPETVRPTAPGTRIERSCRVELPAEPLPDPEGRGALEIAGEGITVELAGELCGAARDALPDTLDGIGIRVTGRGATVRGTRVSGYRVAIRVEADGVTLEDCVLMDNFRQRLRSTPAKEAEEDWLEPHGNDAGEWLARYGAAIHVERARGVTVRRTRVREGQNGLVLDRCEGAAVYDNDFSFLSGWGIALWRSSDNALARNACDFCVRGYSHGVYNRGQDSAGILLFEQCSRNTIAENSATHCGDGLFAFAGQEALGSTPRPSDAFDYRERGCNENEIWGNDFSYAAAHGLELTFGFRNRIAHNQLSGNAICGIWAGYSRGTAIFDNRFADNGQAGYGLERGGVNIEHGQGNVIASNRFDGNACGVHLWWDRDEGLEKLPWLLANGDDSQAFVVDNEFTRDAVAIQARGPTTVVVSGNRMNGVGIEFQSEPAVQRIEASPDEIPRPELSRMELPGTSRPVGARAHLRGREHIRMGEWGPEEPQPGGERAPR